MNILQKWCDRTWLYLVYVIGIGMFCVLIWFWDGWEMWQKLICLLAVIVPMHICEENTLPGGFFFMNNLGFGSDQPRVFPQNRCTNMVTNLGASILFIVLTFVGGGIAATVVTVVMVFGFAEAINHARAGILMYRRYRDKGKRTIYGPGTITAWCVMVPLSVASLHWLIVNPVTAGQVWIGIGIVLLIVICLILVPFIISRRVKSERFAFSEEDIGYFAKYEN